MVDLLQKALHIGGGGGDSFTGGWTFRKAKYNSSQIPVWSNYADSKPLRCPLFLNLLMVSSIKICSVERKNSLGGTSRSAVMAQIKTVREYAVSLPTPASEEEKKQTEK